ncbi:uncharacterized protein PFLUO_LOCUS8813 [Penicillium psychrofluorescens]|uniref:uncharacterized protein n=1 Tax=Penicillium psychrofluorescens TaxID=3158075 RepID=UPI003CCE28DC
MRPFKASDLLDAGTRTRSTSVSSDTPLTRVNLMSPPFVTPPPGFISSSAASEIITADQEFNTADFVADDDEGAGIGATAVVTPAALSLLNGFLDNILFNILGVSKSTQLTCIRPAVTDVLKPRLAAEVVTAADDELSEYMGGADDEEHEFRGGQEPGGDFDLIRSWKLTRLRCMVYTRLGDMEEDDEDEFIAQDSLGDSHGAPRRFSSHVDNITPAAAIFLTSIIEYIGERALVIAGETARSRLSAKLNDNGSEDADRTSIDRLVVEDLDMEKLALNATLGRLWRTWRKRRRGAALSRTLSRDSFHRRRYTTMGASRKSSISTIEEPVTPREIPAQESDPASIPLPMNEYDIQEIEIPGYKSDPVVEIQTMKAIVAHKVRPRSLMVIPSPLPLNSPLASKESPSSNASPVDPARPDQPKVIRHVRSRSLPSSTSSPVVQVASGIEVLRSPTSDKNQEAVEDDDESAEFVDAAESAPGLAITTSPTTAELSPAERQRMSVVPEEEEEAVPHPDNLHVSDMVASLRSRDTGEPLSEVSSLNERDLRTSDQASISSMSERGNDNAEIIEGRGTYEKPKQTATVQRPKRKSSRGITQPPPITAEAILPPTQGAETTPILANEAIKSSTEYDDMDGDEHKSPMMAALGHGQQPEEPRPDSTSSNYSQRSQSSRRHKPAPLIVAASNRTSSRRTDSSSSTATERAAVQRMPRASTSVTTAPVPVRPARSESLGQRPMTANSTTSQVSTKLKGFISRQPGDSPSLRLRSSSDTSRASGDTGDSPAEDGTDLDKLINSDETIHYTLTPRSVREMGFPDVPPKPIPRSDMAGTSDLANFLKNTAPPGDDMPASRPSVSSKTNRDSAKYVPIASRMSTSSARAKVPVQARDARLGGDSTRDLAEFMKATGPINGPTSAPLKPNMPKASPTSPKSNRPRLQARGADTAAGSQTSDLIDFIREGPPQPGGAHRIPRTVAPFRNTVDSDDLQLDQATRNSLASTQDSSAPSSGSRTALLDSASRLKGRMEYAAASKAATQDSPAPVRRNRFQGAPDPYAIDDDEDDDLLEELLEAEPVKPKRQEESLMDFLRDAPPPPPSEPEPLSINIPQNNNSSSHGFASDMKARLLRSAGGDRTDRSPSTKLSRTSLRSQTSNYAAPPSNYTAKVGMERNAGTTRTMPNTSNRTTETGALADFLRNTGPPEPVSPRQSSSSMGNNMNNTFSRLFVRRRKVEA